MLEKFKNVVQAFIEGDPTTSMAGMALEDEDTKEYVRHEFEQGVISDIKKKFDDRKRQRQHLELQWRLNINFYNGDQFTFIDNITHDIRETPFYTDWEERNVFNEIAPNMETRYAFLSKRKNQMKNILKRDYGIAIPTDTLVNQPQSLRTAKQAVFMIQIARQPIQIHRLTHCQLIIP